MLHEESHHVKLSLKTHAMEPVSQSARKLPIIHLYRYSKMNSVITEKSPRRNAQFDIKVGSRGRAVHSFTSYKNPTQWDFKREENPR